jgi:hypothetical protein
VFEGVAFVLATVFAFRFSLRLERFALLLTLLLLALMLASAMIITTSPTPIMPSAASPPSIHQMALDFLRGAGVGVHWGCG